jgi:transglutaminase-like putative cysteine protease
MRKQFLFALLAVCLLGVSSVRADAFTPPTPAELALKDVSFAPGASAVVLDWTIERDDDRDFENQHVRIKVLTEEGKKFANVELPYVRRSAVLRKIEARTIQPDGTIKPFDGQVYDKLLVKVRRYDVSAKTFTLPDVRVGSILEYSFTEEWTDWAGVARWPVEREIPVLREHYSIKPWRGPLALMYMSNATDVKPQAANGRYEVDIHNVPAYVQEPLSPPEELIRQQITFYYQVNENEKDKYWGDVSTALYKIVDDFVRPRAAVDAAAKAAIAGATTDEEKAKKLYARVQQVRNLTYEHQKSEQESKREKLRENKRAEDVLTNGYGTAFDVNQLFIALARSAGLSADVVLLCDRGSPIIKEVPDFSQFDHLGVVMTIDGKKLYCDPGVPFLPFGMLRWDNAFTDAYVDNKLKNEWVMTPDATTFVKRKANMHIDGEGLAGSVHLELTGQAALKHRLDLRFDDEAAQKKAFEDEAKKWFPDGSTVKLTSLGGMKGSDEPLVADFDVTIANIVSLTGSRMILPLSLFETTAKNLFAAEKRSHPFFIDYTYTIDDAVTLQVPEGYKVETVPDIINADGGALKYRSQTTRGDTSIAYTRRLQLGTSYVTAENYNALRRFMSTVATADQSSVSFRKQ